MASDAYGRSPTRQGSLRHEAAAASGGSRTRHGDTVMGSHGADFATTYGSPQHGTPAPPIIGHQPPPSSRGHRQDLFAALDVDGDGVLTRNEFSQVAEAAQDFMGRLQQLAPAAAQRVGHSHGDLAAGVGGMPLPPLPPPADPKTHQRRDPSRPYKRGPGVRPTRVQLVNMMTEKTLDELEALAGSDWHAELARLLGSHPEDGLPNPVTDIAQRREDYGMNQFEEKKLTPYWRYVLNALQDKIILILLFMATVELIFGQAFGHREKLSEPIAIYITVFIIVNVQSTLDWKRERLFESLSKKVAASNLRYVVRGGQQMQVQDSDIVVGDVVSFNAHMAATVSCDGILLSGDGVKADESALTGEPEPMSKSAEKPFMISGTTINAGSGKMLVVAVGEYSIAGKIKKSVYSDGEDQDETPLFQKLDNMANSIAYAGMAAACWCFVAKMVNDFALAEETKSWMQAFENILYAIGILAVAVPEGLPLALTIALAFCSSKLSTQNNLVKSLGSCETMGSATTICTDKTGTLTANRMTVRCAMVAGESCEATGAGLGVGGRLKDDRRVSAPVKELVGNLIGVCTMDESGFSYQDSKIPTFRGNPTECALLKLAEEMGFDYNIIRSRTVGRSAETRNEGCPRDFSSARKMMSWAVPNGRGYRLYAKGASEIILDRCSSVLQGGQLTAVPLGGGDKAKITKNVIDPFAGQAMRTIGLSYRDFDSARDLDKLHASITNSDGTPAFECETNLTLVGIVGIEDPLRPEIVPAIECCYKAGIDVRMVTGDNLATAIAIAKQAGILDLSLHCDEKGNVLPTRAMEGKDFRKTVHDFLPDGTSVFNQAKFDQVWPYLRVLARSSPEDKLTLATGLHKSTLCHRESEVVKLRREKIVIFPDEQVIAMTGDGTNDAPALKASDIGFAMGIAGTQIAKDAADIILLDDNFASIVIAAHWGRNVFDCIQMFLQFQLTVNIAILGVNVIVSWMQVDVPLTVLQLLWLNLIMDALASIALASEPPVPEQMDRPPVNRSESIITPRMWCNMLGHAFYQISIILLFIMRKEILPDCEPDEYAPTGTGPGSRHYTIIFNTFVLMQLVNEWNSRKLQGEFNIFSGILQNKTFMVISACTFFIQIFMVQILCVVAHGALKIHPEGLLGSQWAVCLGVAFGGLVWQQLINLVAPYVIKCFANSCIVQSVMLMASAVRKEVEMRRRVEALEEQLELVNEKNVTLKDEVEGLRSWKHDLELGSERLAPSGKRPRSLKAVVSAVMLVSRMRMLVGGKVPLRRQRTNESFYSSLSATHQSQQHKSSMHRANTSSLREWRRAHLF